MGDLTCDEVADSAPAFALDILEPEMRARVAAHLIRCPACRRTVTEMQESAADLLGVVGGTEPDERDCPAVYDAFDVRPVRRRFRMVVSMAAAAMLLVGTTFGPELAQRPGPPGTLVGTGVLVAGDQTVGRVQFYAGRTPVIEVQAESLPTSGTLGVVLTYSDGTASRIGQIEVTGGHATWVGAEPPGRTNISSVILVDSTSHQVASAAAP